LVVLFGRYKMSTAPYWSSVALKKLMLKLNARHQTPSACMVSEVMCPSWAPENSKSTSETLETKIPFAKTLKNSPKSRN